MTLFYFYQFTDFIYRVYGAKFAAWKRRIKILRKLKKITKYNFIEIIVIEFTALY